jgi:hypothetical protein
MKIPFLKNAFIYPDVLFDGYDTNRVVLSKEYSAYDLHTFLSEKVSQVPSIKQCASYDELIEQDFASIDTAFCSFVLSQAKAGPLNFYCDVESLTRLYVTFVKTMFPWLTVEQGVEFLNVVFGGVIDHLRFPLKVPFVSNEKREAYATELAQACSENLAELWSSTTVWKLSRADRGLWLKQLALEYRVASVAAGTAGSLEMAAEVEFVAVCNELMVDQYINDVKNTILTNLLSFNALEPTTSFDATVDNLGTLVREHPEYSFLTDTNFVPEKASYVFATYDLAALRNIQRKVAVFWELADEHNSWNVLFTTDVSIAVVVEAYRTDPCILAQLRECGLNIRVLQYLLDGDPQAFRLV